MVATWSGSNCEAWCWTRSASPPVKLFRSLFMPGTRTATWRAVVRSPNTSAARPSPAGSKSRKWRSGSSSSRSLRRRASSSAHAVGAQPRDLAVDRLGVGGVAQGDRGAVEVADQLRALAGERVGDVRVQTLEERRHSGRIGIPRDHALEVRARRAATACGSTLGAPPPPEHWPAIWQTARAASSAIGRAGPETTSALTITATSSSTPTYSAVTCPRSRRSMARACRGRRSGARVARPNFPAGTEALKAQAATAV